jgi:hypothetical protein
MSCGEPDARERARPVRRAGRGNGPAVTLAPRPVPTQRRDAGGSPEIVRRTNAPRPARDTTVTSAFQRPESVSHASTSGAGTSSGKRPSTSSTARPRRGSAGTRQFLRRQSNQRRGSRLTASFSSSLKGKSKTSSGLRGSSARSQTLPAAAEPCRRGSDIEPTRLVLVGESAESRCTATRARGGEAPQMGVSESGRRAFRRPYRESLP